MSSLKISVIVPVYNTEKYLRRCIDSILAQTFTNFELLLIDDGSEDTSGKICDEYAKKDARVRVFHKENCGVSSARNLGLENACGSYITFVDADDWIDERMYEEMLAVISETKCDIVCCDYLYEYENGNCLYANTLPSSVYQDREKILCDCLKCLITYVWNILVNSRLYRADGISFKGYYCEDFNIYMKLMVLADKVCHIDKAYYHYYQHSQSICHTLSPEKKIDGLKSMRDVAEYLKPYMTRKVAKALACRMLILKQFFLYDEKNVSTWYSTFPESNKYILINSLYGIKAKTVEFLSCVLYRIILRLSSVKL